MTRSQRPPWLGEDRRVWDHIRVHVQVLRDPEIGSYELAVYCGLVAHAELSTGEAHPSIETLAGYGSMSERRARTAAATLERLGYVAIEQRPGTSSSYVVLAPPPLATPAPHAGVEEGSAAHDADHPGTTCRDTPAPHADEQEPGDENPGTRLPDASGAEAVEKVDKYADAKALVDPWWEERRDAGNPVGQPYIAVVKVVASMLKNGVPPNRLAFALRHAPTVSAGALEMAIQRELERRGERDGQPTSTARETRIHQRGLTGRVLDVLGYDPTSVGAADEQTALPRASGDDL